ncbi:SDR family NAD(P)-dependent oxidoreductase [Sphingomonas profundi]|uniref:SDR family NAD(P)-dependent oxidoreductase n=1 Tax=Alterirhizorhabdus profundi TaxID=2681549 RepID=UPI0012E73C82|nr:SDR family oxidoreductase [Sphingomonas profundi]
MDRYRALVIGGTGGFGRASVLAMARDCVEIAISYRRNPEKVTALIAELSEGCAGVPVACDMRDGTSVRRAIADANAAMGRIDAIVVASGVAIGQPYVSQIAEEQWREVIETELMGALHVVGVALPLFRAQGGGNLVFVTSMANTRYPTGDALSSVPKAGIESLIRAVAKEEGRYGIRANSVAPGSFDAGMGSAVIASLYTPEFWEHFKKSIPLRRFGDAEDIGEAVAFFASPRAKYVTGQSLVVDGGFSV